MQKNQRRAIWIAAATCGYLIVSWIQVIVDFPIGPLEPLIYPAAWALTFPAPLLKIFKLADTSWLIGTLPNYPGMAVLLVVYTCAAYGVATYLGGGRHRR